MVLMPPGSAKSTYSSVLFPPWWFVRNPHAAVIAASHTSELAEHFGRRVRDTIREYSATLGYGLSGSSSAAARWDTDAGGTYFAAGVGQKITGRRADLALIDDPVASQEDADSQRVRDSTWNWYRSDLYTRLKPGARVILIMTRWHEDDLGGRLLKEQAKGGDRWKVLELPALAGINDPLGRKPGEPLWPEWEDKAAIQRKRHAVGERAFNALFQQRPVTDEGAIIQRGWWQPWVDPVPRNPDMVLLSLDTAYSETAQADFSACTTWYVTTDETMRSSMLLRHAWQERLAFPDLVDLLLETAREFRKPGIPLRVLVEAKASGMSVIQELRRRAPDLNVHAVVPRHDKVARAHAVTPMLEAGRVYALAKSVDDETGEVDWRERARMVIDQCAAFPLGANDDLCLVGDTAIAMADGGERQIQNINVGDWVLTPSGPAQVSASSCTGVREVWRLDYDYGALEGTGNHPVWANGRWVPLELLCPGDHLYSIDICEDATWIGEQSPASLLRSSYSMVCDIGDIQNPQTLPIASISGARAIVSTAMFGNTTTGQFHTGVISITLMGTQQTTTHPTLNVSPPNLTGSGTCGNMSSAGGHKGSGNTSQQSVSWPGIGTGVMKAESGTEKTLTSPLEGQAPHYLSARADTKKTANGVALASLPRAAGHCGAVHDAKRKNPHGNSVKGVSCTRTMRPVYNLTVDGASCYFANGILVHNCDTLTQALRHVRDLGFEFHPEDEPPAAPNADMPAIY